jgi:hypothetical protein
MDGDKRQGPRTERSKIPRRAWGFIIVVFATSRLFYLLAGALLVRVVPIDAWQQQSSDVPFRTLNIWAHMDGDHLLAIAENGYSVGSPAYFPLYPLLVRAVAEFFGGPLNRGGLSGYGVLISLITFYFALYFVYRIAEEGWGVRVAEGTVLALAFFPTSFFFNAVFTESLFLALSAGAVWAVRVRKDLPLACLLAALATATRTVGVFLLILLLVEWWRDRRAYGWRGAYLLLAPAGLLTYMAYLWWRLGNPLAFVNAQGNWGRGAANTGTLPEIALRLAYENATALLDPNNYEPFGFERLIIVLSGQNYLYNLLFFLGALLVLAVGWRRLLPGEFSAYSLILVGVSSVFGPPDNPLISTPRYLLVVFPLFIVLGALLKDRRLLAGYLLISVPASLVFTALFVGWYFVA